MQDDILTINEILNRLEQALNAENVAPKDIANVLIGNEFTFTNDTLSGLDAEDKDDLHEQMIKPYNALATAWKNAMTNRGIAPFQEYQKDRMLMLTYKFQSAQHGLDWEYKVTPDQKCVEIITSPAKGVDIYGGHVGNYADHYIFNVAQEIQLSAHATIGGGHINIDEKSAFGNYGDLDAEGARRAARVLANFMQEFYTDAAYWEERDTDVPNSPFPKDLTYEAGKNNTITKTKQEDFEALIVKFNQAGWGIEKLADELIDKVFDINLVEASKRESPHYQALNTEHLSSKEQGGTRRLEVRRVPAQSTRQMLMTQLTRIAGLLKVAKERAR